MPERTTKRATRSTSTATTASRSSRAKPGTVKSYTSPKLSAASTRGKSGAVRAQNTSKLSTTPKAKTGVPITDELADKLSEEAERGYDLSLGRRVGRKSLAGGSGKSPRFSFRTTQELYDHAVVLAGETGKSVSEVARDALERYVHSKRKAGRR